MNYDEETSNNLLKTVSEIDPDVAMIFVASANRDERKLDFNFYSRLTNEQTLEVLEQMMKGARELYNREPSKPDLKSI